MTKRWQFRQSQVTPFPIDKVFSFFSDAQNLARLTPPSVGFRMRTPNPVQMVPGALIDYDLKLFGVRMHWQARIEAFEPGHYFVDTQVKGPYRYWRHVHEFEPVSEGTLVKDTVDYELPPGPLGHVAQVIFVKHTLRQMFEYRKKSLDNILAAGK